MSLQDQAQKKLVAFVNAHRIIEAGDKIVVACSGGADSVALLYLLYSVRYTYKLSFLVVHINHQTRPGANEAEAQLVKDLCHKLNLALVIRKIAPEPGADFENRARELRFKELEMILKLYRFNKIALGHHKNDQAETVLMNLMRGAGLNGMAGIKPINGHVIHPLLDFERDELRALLGNQNIAWAEDQSNLDNSYRRNFVRNELLPKMQSEVHPKVVEKIARQAQISLEAETYFRNSTLKRLKKISLEQHPDRIVLDLPKLEKLSAIEQFYLLEAVYYGISGLCRDFFWHSFEEIRALYQAEGSKEITLKNDVLVRKIYQELQFYRSSSMPEIEPEEENQLIEEDRSRTVFMDKRFTFKHIKVLPSETNIDPKIVYLDTDKLDYPLVLRTRIPGDRFMPQGMEQFKKLKDFFIDEKVPKFDRDKVAILCDSHKILWVAGMRVDARAIPTGSSTRFLQVSLEDIHAKPNRAASRKKQGDNE